MHGSFEAPLLCPPQHVLPEWIDYNGHMNVAYYVLAFDRSVDHFLACLGVGPAYVAAGNGSCFVLECHVCYLQELTEGAAIATTCQLLDWDHKRIHYYLEMFRDSETRPAATCEQITLHVDLGTRRSAPMPAPAQAALEKMMHSHGRLARPARSSSVIGIRRD